MFENFQLLATGLNVEPLLKSIQAKPELWSEITARQTTTGSPHIDTESIFLRWCKTQTVDAVFTEIPAVDYPAIELLPEAKELISGLLASVGSTELGRVLIVNLKPGGEISPHEDQGAYADYYERFHICLESKDQNIFYSKLSDHGGEFVHMAPGDAWWFNHKAPHYVANHSDAPRIHLIIDAVAPEFRVER